MEDKKQIELKITIPEKVQSALFSNVAQINATDREVVIDFAFVQPNTNQGIVVSRIALTPEHAKSLQGVLANLLKRYDKNEGAK
ncbi:MAG TPA: DUF3467 domain-containing protein [Candidatus Paceibacterota bacterium]|mgnify:CR=1 FL=1|nr:DUF3467 domain-containing protein [Candidatus Paceibacterota bacterium]HPT40265.1 DUF3467 domain-containing protein [Candidatus Paceibacterota bacterium]